MAAIPSLLQPGDAPFEDRQPLDSEGWSWLASFAVHITIIALLLLFVIFEPDPGLDAEKPIAITYVPAETADQLPAGAEGASNAEAASGAPAPPQAPQPVAQPQPQPQPVQAPPVLSVPTLSLAPFMQPMQTPMTIIRPKPAPVTAPAPAIAPMAQPQVSDLPPLGQGGNAPLAAGAGNGLGNGGGIGNSPTPGPGLGGIGNGPGHGGGGGNEVQYVLIQIDTLAIERLTTAAIHDFIERLTDQCGLVAIQTNDPSWKVEIKVTYGPDGKLMNLHAVTPSRPPSADYRTAAAELMSALANPACNYLPLPAADRGTIHTGTVYLYPLGSTLVPPQPRFGRPPSPYGSGY